MDELDEHTERAIWRLGPHRVIEDIEASREAVPCPQCLDLKCAALARAANRRRLPELDVDAEMRREAAYRLDRAAERMPDKPRIAALSLAFWLTTTATPEATEVARVLLGRAGLSDPEDGA